MTNGSIFLPVAGNIESINGDQSAAQYIVAGAGVVVNSSGGTTTISSAFGTSVIESINGDTTAHQAIVGGIGITVNTSSGVTTITNNGIDNVVAGTGISVSVVSGTATVTNTGLLSINSDATSAQRIVAGSGISVSTVSGTTTITNLGTGGSVTSVSVVTANGVSGTVANPTTTPAITLSLGAITPSSVAATGIITGSNLSGTNTGDQTITLTGDVTGSGAGSFATTLATVNSNIGTFTNGTFTVNAKGLITAASSGTAPITSIAVSAPITSTGGSTPTIGITKATTSSNGYLSSTDWNTFNTKQAAGNYITALTGDVTASGPGSVAATLANTAVTPGSYTNANITIDSKGRITLAANGSSGTGTVSTVSVVSANGLAGTVANPTTTPAITLSTTITGILQGNGTAISAATTGNLTDAGTDGIIVTGGTGAVLGSGTSIAQHVADATHNGYLSSIDWSTFNSKQSAGNYITALTGDVTAAGPGSAAATLAAVNSNVGSFTNANITVDAKGRITAAANGSPGGVTSVTASSPLASSGGSTPNITIQVANTSQSGYLSNTDWNTFNGKQASGNYITALTGDATASGPGSAAITLATVNSNVGSFGSSTAIPSFTVNGKGLITAASTNAVIAPAGTLSGTTLNSTVVTSSLTSVGTIGTGTWQGTAVTVPYGGTGATSFTAYSVICAGSTSTSPLMNVSGLGTTGQLLTSQGSGAMPAWASISGTVGWTAGVVGGPVLVTGQLTGFFVVPYSGTISGWNIAVDQGTLTFKTWKVASGTAVPTVSNSISTSGVSISTGTVIESSTTSDFTTTTVTAGDIIAFAITAVSSTTYASGSIKIARTA